MANDDRSLVILDVLINIQKNTDGIILKLQACEQHSRCHIFPRNLFSKSSQGTVNKLKKNEYILGHSVKTNEAKPFKLQQMIKKSFVINCVHSFEDSTYTRGEIKVFIKTKKEDIGYSPSFSAPFCKREISSLF